MKFSKEVKLFALNILILTICLFSTLYISFNVNHGGYTLLFTQPILYSFVFTLILGRKLLNLNNNLFYLVFTVVSFIRYVLLPVFIVYSGHYGGRSPIPPSEDSYFIAIILMNIELIVVSILILILTNRKKNKINNKRLINFNYNNYDGYYIFFTVTLILLLIFPNVLNQVNFIVPSSLTTNTNFSTIENMVLYCVIVSKQLLYIIMITQIQYRYEKNKGEIWLLLSVIVSLINIFIYFGTNRMDIVISAIVSIYMLIKIYGKKIYKYFLILIPIVLLLFGIVTESRNYVSASDNWAIDFADTLQIYTGGVYNVAIAIETAKFFPQVRNFKVLLMDIFRPMIGPNLLVRNFDIPYSNIFFNRRIRPNSDVVSQIIPMVGQGYIFLGPIFSSVLSLIFIKIQDLLENILNKTYSLEVFYFVSLSSARLGMLMGNNTMNLINDLSMNLVLFALVYIFNKHFKFSSKRKSRKINEKNI